MKSEAAAALKSYLERVETIEDQRQEMGDEIRAIYAEAKAEGFAPKAIRAMVKRRRAKNPAQLDEDETILDTYMVAVGMATETPLSSIVSAMAVDAFGRDELIEHYKSTLPPNGWIIFNIGGAPMRLWCSEDGVAHAEEYAELKPAPAEKTGKALKKSATVLSIVPTDSVKAAADAAERRSKAKRPTDEEAPVDVDEPEPAE